MRKKLHEKFLFNFLARDAENAATIMEAGSGYVVPGIVSDKFETVALAVEKVQALQSVTDTISIGLGGGGNIANWEKVLDIALASQPGHINQPLETAVYAKGYLDGAHIKDQVVNALVKPTGNVGTIQLACTGQMLEVEMFVEIVASLGVESIKMMPVKGTQHIEELIYLTKVAATKGIRGVEPAGGIDSNNIKDIMLGVKDIDIEYFMPHIFGSSIDKKTSETIPEVVREIVTIVEGI
ncbi:uncharacterized protein (TIGR03581 family) [Virgibacillus halotolerans]|uniref:KDGP aldolase n=1 Tax=Virgibacillus halotolerans TaxID=1071053 RepID=UPI0019618EBA|nr:KDGP aldolase [Virgibacillus halotolerans]MBM7600006.1 uncharacterized protein (TIGR03581 family) [Virgibacillus halotolerans]